MGLIHENYDLFFFILRNKWNNGQCVSSISVKLGSMWRVKNSVVSVLCYFAYIVKHREYLLLCEEEAATRHSTGIALYDACGEV